MKLAGASGRAIAAALEVKPRTVYLWMSDPRVKRELVRLLERINDRFTELEAAAAVRDCSWPLHRALEDGGPGADGAELGGEVAAR